MKTEDQIVSMIISTTYSLRNIQFTNVSEEILKEFRIQSKSNYSYFDFIFEFKGDFYIFLFHIGGFNFCGFLDDKLSDRGKASLYMRSVVEKIKFGDNVDSVIWRCKNRLEESYSITKAVFVDFFQHYREMLVGSYFEEMRKTINEKNDILFEASIQFITFQVISKIISSIGISFDHEKFKNNFKRFSKAVSLLDFYDLKDLITDCFPNKINPSLVEKINF